jgi:ATP-dependent phosphofructokinase / diphosphate-dependent phosphofructokinase
LKVGVLTGGGDCPGLNAVIRAIIRKGIIRYGYVIYGIYQGWRGLMEEGLVRPLDLDDTSGILPKGGTILRTSRTNPFKVDGGPEKVLESLKKNNIQALIAIGGDDTLSVAAKLFELGVKVVGVPKTIDNDIWGTDRTFGFDTAVNIATDAIDRIHTTAESHNRVMVVEVMGRHAGWIAIESGLAGGADMILIPERPADLEKVCTLIRRRHERGKDFSIVVAAEGTKIKTADHPEGTVVTQDGSVDEFGHVRLGGIGNYVAQEIEKRLGYESRVVILGHIQRGGSPTAFDRNLGTRYGLYAIDLVHQGKFGYFAALKGSDIVGVPLAEMAGKTRTVDDELYEMAEVFFG